MGANFIVCKQTFFQRANFFSKFRQKQKSRSYKASSYNTPKLTLNFAKKASIILERWLMFLFLEPITGTQN